MTCAPTGGTPSPTRPAGSAAIARLWAEAERLTGVTLPATVA
ncbi:hypothetical protein ACFSKW_29610 [Nonomuraea mangrovi]|uniref:Uncharacterized protein n=1 Tax=Nonomuraea mangrovi TaxID=2316207 RepID=A0ABW4T3D0_9ACTN